MKIPNGFTLVEIAVVLVIVGLLVGGLLIPLSVQWDQNRINITQQRLEEIKKALLGFLVVNNRLPCPDLNENGLESTTCNNEGNIPWRVLGVGRYDAWGNPFHYQVDVNFTNNSSGIHSPNPAASDGLIVKDRQGNELNTVNSGDSNIVAIIFSWGKNGRLDVGTINNVYIQDVYVENKKNQTKTFDDILIWLPKSVLINYLVMVNKWP